MIPATETTPSGLCPAMSFHHARVEAAGRHALSMLRLEGATGALGSFRDFQRELDAHFAAEEKWMLPSYVAQKPQAAERIRADHESLRAELAKIAAGFEALQVDERVFAELLERLTAHAQLEEMDFYQWADATLEQSSTRAVICAIEASELGTAGR